MSPYDLKHIETPDWIDPSKGEPTSMLFSVVDDRTGVSDMEYRCVYGEDAESVLRCLGRGLRRDRCVSVMYFEELHAGESAAPLWSTGPT